MYLYVTGIRNLGELWIWIVTTHVGWRKKVPPSLSPARYSSLLAFDKIPAEILVIQDLGSKLNHRGAMRWKREVNQLFNGRVLILEYGHYRLLLLLRNNFKLNVLQLNLQRSVLYIECQERILQCVQSSNCGPVSRVGWFPIRELSAIPFWTPFRSFIFLEIRLVMFCCKLPNGIAEFVHASQLGA